MQPGKLLTTLREKKPLVHHITNWVTIYDCANICRSLGSLPIMAHAPEEVAQMQGISNTLVLNIGTLTNELVEAMILAGKAANEKGNPVILDAVGAGATNMRTEAVKKLLQEIKIDVIKGNSAEIGVIAGVEAEVKGVEAISVKGDPAELTKKLAQEAEAVVVSTGKTDYISNGKDTYVIKNGHEYMGLVVGTGCMAASVIASFCAVEKDYAKAAAAALSVFGTVGELAAEKSNGPGSYKENFYDALYNLDEKTVNKMQKIEQL
jgi:hydroxyethylthiazole kinase